MGQSDAYKRYGLKSGLNQDDAPEDVYKEGDYLNSVNLRNTGSEGQQLGYNTSIEGNEALAGSLLPGINQVVGGSSFDDSGQISPFRYNSAGNCQIVLYDSATNTYKVIYTDKTDSAGQTLLPLNPQNTVLAFLVNETYMIWWAKDLEVGYVNLKTLASGGYGTVLWEDLSLLKPQCPIPPTGTYGSDAGQPSNYLYGNLPQIIAQYVNVDFNYSAWSTRSKRIVPYQENTPTLGANVGQNNYIIISVNIGSVRASTINIGRRFDDSGDFSQIKSVDRAYVIALPNTSVNVATQVYEAYDPTTNLYSFAYYNNTIAIPIPAPETDLLYDYIWQANSGVLLNGNIAAIGDWKTLYARPIVGVNIAAIGYNPNIAIPAGTYPNPFYNAGSFPGASGSGAGDHRRRMSVSFGGIPHTGDTILVVLADIRNANATTTYSYTVPASQDGVLGAVVGSFSEEIPGSNLYDNGDGTFTINFVGNPYYGLQTFSVELFFSGALVANSIPTFLENTSYQGAIEWFDYKSRPFPITTDNTFIFNTPSKAQVSGQAIQVVLTILNAVAPVGAVTYQVLITKPPVIKILDVTGAILTFKGVWDAYADSPSLSVNSGNIGDTYQITAPANPGDTAHYKNLGTGEAYITGDYITNVGGSNGSSGAGQYYAVLPRSFGNLAGNEILALSLNPLSLFNANYSQQGVASVLTYDYAVGDRCTFHGWLPLTGAIGTFLITGGTGYTNGVYNDVALTGGTGSGAVGNVTVTGGKVTAVILTNSGTGYTNNDTLTGTVTGGTGWHIQVTQLAFMWFNNPCVDVAVLGYDPTTYIVKLEKSSAFTYASGHINYNGNQIDVRNIFFRLYSPAPQTQTASATQSETVWYEVGQQYNITDGLLDTLSITINDGGAYYKTRQFDDAIAPYQSPPIQTLSTDFNYSDFYPSQFSSFGRVRTYYDVLEQTEQKASIITSQPYILGSKVNGLNRFYPANIYGDSNGQTSSSKGGIQIMWQRGQVLVCIQQLGTFYIPVNEAYTVLNQQITGQSISEKLLNNGRYAPENVGLGLTKCFCTRYSTGYGIDPNKSLPYKWTIGGIELISGKMSKYFKSVIQLAYSLGKQINMFYNDYYEEVVLTIQAEGGILLFFPFKDGIWDDLNHYIITGDDVSATPNGAHCTASYDPSTGLVTYTPTSGYVGSDTATFTFNPGTGNITLNNCLQWTAGSGTPFGFSFAPQFNVPTSTVIYSNTILVGNINIPVVISIVDGEYSINGGPFTSSPGTVVNGDIVQVNQTSSASETTLTTATLTIGGVSADFDVTTGTTPETCGLAPTVTSVDTGLGIIHTDFVLDHSLGGEVDITYSISYIQNGTTHNPVVGVGTTIFSGNTDTGDIEVAFDPGAGTLTDVIFMFSVSPNPIGDGTFITYTSPTTIVV